MPKFCVYCGEPELCPLCGTKDHQLCSHGFHAPRVVLGTWKVKEIIKVLSKTCTCGPEDRDPCQACYWRTALTGEVREAEPGYAGVLAERKL